VAGRAVVRRKHVARHLAVGRKAIVTTHTVRRRRECAMVRACGRQPGFGGVALATGDLSHDVAEWLSGFNNAVMACGTVRRSHTNVVKACAGECGSGVAGAARKRGLKVVSVAHYVANCQVGTIDVARSAGA
jgi:putative NADH-flavin reductase